MEMDCVITVNIDILLMERISLLTQMKMVGLLTVLEGAPMVMSWGPVD